MIFWRKMHMKIELKIVSEILPQFQICGVLPNKVKTPNKSGGAYSPNKMCGGCWRCLALAGDVFIWICLFYKKKIFLEQPSWLITT